VKSHRTEISDTTVRKYQGYRRKIKTEAQSTIQEYNMETTKLKKKPRPFSKPTTRE
jgi:hypothetical protein